MEKQRWEESQKKKQEDQRRERVRRKKKQAPERVEKSRSTACFQSSVALEDRKVGSLHDTTLHHATLHSMTLHYTTLHYNYSHNYNYSDNYNDTTLHNTTLLTLYTRPDTILQQPATVQHTTVRDMRAHYTHYTTPHIQLQLHHTNHTTVQPQLHHTTTIATAALQDTTSSSCGKDGTGHSVALKDGASLGATACSA